MGELKCIFYTLRSKRPVGDRHEARPVRRALGKAANRI